MHALDAHLFTLRAHLSKLHMSSSHMKTVSAELRVLVCKSAKVEGLLWRLVDALDINDGVYLNAPGNFDMDHPLMTGLSFGIASISRGNHQHPYFQPQTYSLKEVIKHCDALIANGKPLTHEQLISAVAQQIGSAHEADKVDPALVQLSSIFICGIEPFVKVMALDAALVLEVGERVLAEAESKLNFSRSHHEHDYGNLTFFTSIGVHKLPRDPIRVFRLQSFVSLVSIDCFLTAVGSEVVIKKREHVLFKDASSFDMHGGGDWCFAEAWKDEHVTQRDVHP